MTGTAADRTLVTRMRDFAETVLRAAGEAAKAESRLLGHVAPISDTKISVEAVTMLRLVTLAEQALGIKPVIDPDEPKAVEGPRPDVMVDEDTVHFGGPRL